MWEGDGAKKDVSLYKAAFLFFFYFGRRQTKMTKDENTITTHCWAVKISKSFRIFQDTGFCLFLSYSDCLLLLLLWNMRWMWLVQVNTLAHKAWAFFAFTLLFAMTLRYTRQMKVVSKWQLRHLQKDCLLWRESWHQSWCKWWSQPTQMDSWIMTVIPASTKTCRFHLQI